MGHYDSAYEHDQMYGRAPHQSELQKANSKIRDLEARIKELEKESRRGVKFTVNGVEKEFELINYYGILYVKEINSQFIIGINPDGTYYRPDGVNVSGYQLNRNGQIKQQKDSP